MREYYVIMSNTPAMPNWNMTITQPSDKMAMLYVQKIASLFAGIPWFMKLNVFASTQDNGVFGRFVGEVSVHATVSVTPYELVK